MRESLSRLHYNNIPVFIFYERTSRFTRYDIVYRISNSLKEFYEDFIAIYIIEYNNSVETIICRRIGCSKLLTDDVNSLVNALDTIFNECYELLILEEEGIYDLKELCNKKCFLLGLHETSNLGNVAKSFSSLIKIISLGEVSYLTSQCIKIIGYINTVLCREKDF
ncbi:MAG: hypothetical protein DRO40_02065 [Thermoprotei archaeon]|nr:MAG: hypothetical protein DRO40_02065 [Thermoprotei archaeon]